MDETSGEIQELLYESYLEDIIEIEQNNSQILQTINSFCLILSITILVAYVTKLIFRS